MNHDLRKPDVLDGPFAMAALRARNTVEEKKPFVFRFAELEAESVKSAKIRLLDTEPTFWQPIQIGINKPRRTEPCPIPTPSTKRVMLPIWKDGKPAYWSMTKHQYERFREFLSQPRPEKTRWQKLVAFVKRMWPWK